MASLLKTIEARKVEIDKELDGLVKTAEKEKRTISDEEKTRFDALLEERKSVVKQAKTAAKVAAVRESSAVELVGISDTATFKTEERAEPYRQGGKDSFFRDLAAASKGDSNASDRLVRNTKYVADQLEQRGETTVAGAGGEFDPPLWAINQWIKLMRPARTTADLVNKQVLPPGLSSINIPKVLTGTLTAQQTTQNTGVSVQDITTMSVSAPVLTVAGGAVYSLQFLQQSPIPVDQVIIDDLTRDLANKIDNAVIAAVAATAGLNSVTYTSASPTSVIVGTYVQQAIDQVLQGNYTNPNAIIMRPDRWGHLLAAGDSAGRPFILPNTALGNFNTLGQANGQNVQGLAGSYRGVNVYLDPLIPINLGAGVNQDEIFVLDTTQVSLYESTPYVSTFEQTYANQLSMFIRLHEYYAVLPNRLPKAISLITGTGMIQPAYGV